MVTIARLTPTASSVTRRISHASPIGAPSATYRNSFQPRRAVAAGVGAAIAMEQTVLRPRGPRHGGELSRPGEALPTPRCGTAHATPRGAVRRPSAHPELAEVDVGPDAAGGGDLQRRLLDRCARHERGVVALLVVAVAVVVTAAIAPVAAPVVLVVVPGRGRWAWPPRRPRSRT